MVKIKRKVEMTLPELIQWGWDTDIKEKAFYNNVDGGSVYFDKLQNVSIEHETAKNETFTIEVEEEIEIDEYTVFHTLVKIVEDGTVYTCTDATINREKNSAVVVIYAKLNGVLKLIWTRDKGLVE